MSSSLALDHLASGKVRELYDAGDGRLLMVASDRISAFDVVLPTPIPDKGRVLTALSLHWFALTTDIVRNHVISARVEDFPEGARDPGLAGRSLLVRRLEMLPLECVVRGYLAGSGWKDYGRTGAVCGIPLPAGLREAEHLPRTLFTPSTKATTGHDENITAEQGIELVGEQRYREVEQASIALYERAAASALERGIILADTKFEFGIDGDGGLVVADEVLTPDSSRFWPADSYAAGASPPSFDKQYVRDWLETQPWDKTPPGPELPDEVRDGTAARYREAFERLAGRPFTGYLDEMGVRAS
jgi:phosphoribosylaminoimidazole-succinocarboxamide synthase